MNKRILTACLASTCGFLMACSDYSSGDQTTVAKNESSESPNFGSATDIVPADGSGVSTNNLNVADNGIGGPMQRQSGNFESQSLPGQSSDQELAKQIRIALTTGSVGTTGAIAEDQLTKIQVQSQNGNVTLTGPVASENEKRTVEKQVAGMKGVKSVNNQLTVTPSDRRNAIDSPVPRTSGNQ
jgi:hypothetical protein